MIPLAGLALVLLPAPAATAAPPPPVAEAADDDGEARLPSKKQKLLRDKRTRRPVHATEPRQPLAHGALTLRNLWTYEVLPIDPARPPTPAAWNGFLRDHYTNQAARMDPRLGEVLVRAAARFQASAIEIVSAYRSAKYNLMLRKKGHAVARDSQHPLGHAIDFRLSGVPTRELFQFVRSLRLGGAGYYPQNAFVHADVGRVRTWNGE